MSDPESDPEIGFDQLHGLMSTLMTELQEHFGDREPSEEEVREFLTERLRKEGRPEDEVQRIMHAVAE